MRGLLTMMKGCVGPNVYPAVPDGGWGWVVAVAFFFVEVFTYGIIKTFGIFLQDLKGEFSESNSRVSWVVSICVFIMAFTAPLSTLLSNRFGYRPVVMMGGFLISLGTICTGFTNSITEMYITVGIVSGLGYCLAFLPTVTILSQYFSRRRSLVTAVASSGECVTLFALAPALVVLKEKVGWRYCMVVIGVLQASVMACGALLRPIIIQPPPPQEQSGPRSPLKQADNKYELENEITRTSYNSVDSGVQSLSDGQGRSEAKEVTEETGLREAQGGEKDEGEAPPKHQKIEELEVTEEAQAKLLDFSILRDGSFLCYSLFGLFATLGFFAPQLYIIDLSVSRGVDRDRATYMLSTMAVAEIFGRLSIGWVLNRQPIRKLHILLICTSLLCGVLVLFTMVTEFWGLAVCCALYGYLMGTVGSTHIPMLAEDDVVGIKRMPSAVGVYVCIQSFAGLAGPPLGGFLVDRTQNYASAFYSCAAGMALGALFLGLVRPAGGHLRCCGPRAQRHSCSQSSGADQAPDDFLEVDLPEGSPNEPTSV